MSNHIKNCQRQTAKMQVARSMIKLQGRARKKSHFHICKFIFL